MVAVPVSVALAVTTPVDPTTLAIPLPILQVPPALASVSVVLVPWHKNKLPLIAEDVPLTVTVNIPIHPPAVV